MEARSFTFSENLALEYATFLIDWLTGYLRENLAG